MYYKQHQNLIQQFKLQVIKEIPNLHLFDRHVGLFYTKNNVPLKIGLNGQADLYGLYNNGKQLIHIEIEAKTGNAKQSKEQKNWQAFIEKNNGIYILLKNDINAAILEIKNLLN